MLCWDRAIISMSLSPTTLKQRHGVLLSSGHSVTPPLKSGRRRRGIDSRKLSAHCPDRADRLCIASGSHPGRGDTKNGSKSPAAARGDCPGASHLGDWLGKEMERLLSNFLRGYWHVPFRRSAVAAEPIW